MNSQPAFFIRMATPSDAQTCHEIDVEAWGAESAASVEMLLARITRYPLGNFVAIDRATGEIAGSVWTMALDDKPVLSWWETTGQGSYEGTCNPFGDMLLGVNVSIREAYAGCGLGEKLVVRAGETAWLMGKRKAVLGSRIPEYHKWQHLFTAEDYIRLERASGIAYFRDPATGALHQGPAVDALRASQGGRIDPRAWPLAASEPAASRTLDAELAFFLDMRINGRRCRLFQLLPGYFPDPDSCDNGVLIGWENEDHPAVK